MERRASRQSSRAETPGSPPASLDRQQELGDGCCCESPLVPRPELQRRHPHARSKRSRIAGPDYLVRWWFLRSLFCNAGHFVAREVAGSELRGYTNQETHHTDLKQIPLRQVNRQEQPGRNVKMHQSTT